jgi:hypothetical protein
VGKLRWLSSPNGKFSVATSTTMFAISPTSIQGDKISCSAASLIVLVITLRRWISVTQNFFEKLKGIFDSP